MPMYSLSWPTVPDATTASPTTVHSLNTDTTPTRTSSAIPATAILIPSKPAISTTATVPSTITVSSALCEEDFDDDQELYDHQQRVHHRCPRCGKVGCYECGLTVVIHPPLQFFDSSWELRNHRTNDHFYCEPCDRFFRTLDNLKAHKRSSIHKARDHHCPHVGCNKVFLDNADLVAHWETGTCPSGVDRHRIDEAFVAVDSRYFTDPAVLVADSYGNRRAPPPSKARVRDSMRDGDTWKCSRCSRTFKTRDILRQHLRGPAHAPRFYRCAEAYNGCNSHFSVLSALVRHTESECCSLRSIVLRLQLDTMRGKIF